MSVDVHIFRSRGGQTYCLDVNSSAVFRVDDVVADLLQQDSTPGQHRAGEHRPGTRVDAQAEIAAFQAQGFLLPAPEGRSAVPESERSEMRFKAMSLFVAGGCNLACLYCFNDGGQCGGDELPWMRHDTATRAIDLLLAHSAGPVNCNMFGGEPLLRFDLIKNVVGYCESKDRPFRYGIVTNGTVMNDDVVRFLAEKKFNIVVSYDGYLQDRHRVARDGLGRREIVRANIGTLARALPRENLSVRAILTRGPIELSRIVDEARDLGVQLEFSVATLPSGHPLAPSVDDVAEIMAQEEDLCFRGVDDATRDLLTVMPSRANAVLQVLEGRPRQYSCSVGKDIFSVSTTGDIYPCHRFVGDRARHMGHVDTGVSYNVWKTYADRFVDNRDPCSTCWARYFCGGGCAHHSVVHAGDINSVSTPMCDLTRFEIELGLRLYVTALEENPAYLSRFNSTAKD